MKLILNIFFIFVLACIAFAFVRRAMFLWGEL